MTACLKACIGNETHYNFFKSMAWHIVMILTPTGCSSCNIHTRHASSPQELTACKYRLQDDEVAPYIK